MENDLEAMINNDDSESKISDQSSEQQEETESIGKYENEKMGYIKKMLIDIADCDGYSIEDNIYNNKNNIHPITDNIQQKSIKCFRISEEKYEEQWEDDNHEESASPTLLKKKNTHSNMKGEIECEDYDDYCGGSINMKETNGHTNI